MNSSITGYCADGISKFWFLDFSIAPNLLYYAYVPILIVSIILGILIFTRDKKSIINKLFLVITSAFSLWIINVFIQWIAIPNYYIYLSWVLIPIFEIPIYLSSIYFIDVFCNKIDISLKKKYLLSGIYIVIIILSFTSLNISGYDYENCEGIPGLLLYFIYLIEFISLLWIAWIGSKYIKKTNIKPEERKSTKLLTIGLVTFLGIFLFSEIFGQITYNFEINLIGPIGMLIFIALITYSIVEYHSFNIKLLATQALIWGLAILIGSQFFFIKSNTNMILNGITFVGIIILGQFLVKSVKKEVMQREQLQILTEELFKANEKLKSLDQLKTEFLSLASHQLRSPLTAIKGYTSMLLEGDYGKIDPKAKETIERVFESTNNLTIVVEDLLNVAKIEQGGMKYEMASFNLSEIARDMAKDLSITAEKKGLKLSFEETGAEDCMTVGDKDKLRQVVLNFIDNSIKYTKAGEIKVKVETKGEKVIFSVKDTGMGMTEEIKETLFQKFARGEGGRIDSSGTGLGLYLAKEIAEAHKGKVWVESEGPGKGSTFFMELGVVSN